MKKRIKLYAVMLMTVFMFMPRGVAASEHVKMCDETNTWVYISGPAKMNGELGRGLTFMRFIGDKEINGQVYHEFNTVRTLFLSDTGRSHEYGPSEHEGWLFREEGDKVWCYTLDYTQYDISDVLMYDFGVKTGDSFPGQGIDDFPFSENHETFVLPDTVLGGLTRKRYAPNIIGTDYVVDMECIEGIGTTWGFLPGIYTGYLTKAGPDKMTSHKPAQRCNLYAVFNDSGDFLYGDKESYNRFLNEITGISVIMDSDDDAAPSYYNLQGQRISTPEKGQICIERRGGKARKILM